MNFDYAIAAFEKERMAKEIEVYKDAQSEREEFLKRFPFENIKNLSLEEYAFVNSNDGFSDSFCTVMYSRLEKIAHTGNAYTNMFGIYYKRGRELSLSSKYRNRFGDDYERAFLQIKEDIYTLLEGVNKKDFTVVEKSYLQMTFKYKLLAVYFPDIFLPVCTGNMMEAVCRTMGVPYGKREMVYSNIDLVKIKESNPLTSGWNNSVFLGFCRWLGDNEQTNREERMRRLSEMANNIDIELDSLGIKGEEREVIAKARVNQDVFRDFLLERYPTCALCKVSDRSLLVASHIKPWRESCSEEKTDIDNGFILCPNHDKLFDKGYISFDDDGNILISEILDVVNRTYTNVREGMNIHLTEGNKNYIKYHRENIYKG